MLWNIMIVHLLGLMTPGPDFFMSAVLQPVIHEKALFVQ